MGGRRAPLPRPGHGGTGTRREHHRHWAALAAGFRPPCKRPGKVGWAAAVAPSLHAAVPVRRAPPVPPRDLEEGQGRSPAGARPPLAPLPPFLRPSLPAAVTARPPSARVSRWAPGRPWKRCREKQRIPGQGKRKNRFAPHPSPGPDPKSSAECGFPRLGRRIRVSPRLGRGRGTRRRSLEAVPALPRDSKT